MKLKILVKIIEKLFGMMPEDDQPRADMFLPDRLLAMALVFLAGGAICAIIAVFKFAIWAIVCAVLGIVLGVFAVLCWKNQSIHIISNDQFTYTTMFGNTYTYSFSDIQGLRRNQDSMTLFVASKKVHIEAMAIISDRLIERINKALLFDEKYVQMSASELSKLTDDEILNAVWTRTENIVSSKENLLEGFNSLNEEQRIFYAVNYLEMEVNNGGLCQFFVNSSRIVAPVVSDYMGIIGASEHKKLYDTFIEKYQINTYDLSSFDCETVEVFQSQYERYPFDEYDDVFYELEPLQNYLISFVRKHIKKF
ncbi:MAG: DUF4375 domain-containing protein [Clostridia bacterium]|nr:DUF4375 domain-containing protein [Clostridia bacterium]